MNDSKPYDALKDYVMRGTGFTDGKKRVREYFATHEDIKDRTSFIKNEFGTGGFGIPCDKPYTLHCGYHDAKGHRLQYYDAEMNEVVERYTHRQVAKKIDELIANNEY